jgi:oxygen-independent coproporphyrinogen III oxidase
LLSELRQKASLFAGRQITSIYFGGGTPSLIPAELIVALVAELEKQGIKRSPDAEVTLEINPATVDPHKMATYLEGGVNRFSVGAQTFDDVLLQSVHREHNSEQTRQTLDLLRSFGVNFSFDLLFALPGQSLDILDRDLDEVLNFSPHHVSSYCLTVPEGHALFAGRPLDDIQLQMFDMISTRLKSARFDQYEISNFAQPGFQSRHNCSYWDDSEYWGLGLSAHSYSPKDGWGTRYWNASSIGAYKSQVLNTAEETWSSPFSLLPESQQESLEPHQSLTDFCHTSLRMRRGLSTQALVKKFGSSAAQQVVSTLAELRERGWVEEVSLGWTLTGEGIVLSNQVFSALTFLKGEVQISLQP